MEGLHAFIHLAWPQVEPSIEYQDNWHIADICKHLEAVSRCEIRDLIINVPPGCMKSLLVCVFWPAWEQIRSSAQTSYIYSSFDNRLTLRDSLRTKELIESTWFQERWGSRSLKVVSDDSKSNSASQWYLHGGAMRISTSGMGKATGNHADIAVSDDPLKAQDLGEAKLEQARRGWDALASRRKNPATFRRVLIMQRLHENDLAGQLLKEEPDAVHLCYPMEFEADNPCKTKWGGDPRTEEGELLWPARYPAESIAQIKRSMGSAEYATQYQQRPNPPGGGIFQRAWLLRRWKALPKGVRLYQSWDMRFKDDPTSGDWVVGQLWGYHDNDFYLVDETRGRWGFNETCAALQTFSAKHPKARLKLVENKANGPAVCAALKRTITGIVLVDPEGGKIARANAVSPIFESGHVLFPYGEHEWLDDVFHELEVFPRGRHDDRVDAATQAINRFLVKRNSFKNAMRKIIAGA